jgi:hypothetical protein
MNPCDPENHPFSAKKRLLGVFTSSQPVHAPYQYCSLGDAAA